MRTAVLIGKKKDGTYVTLAHPDTPIVEQKLFLKQLRQEQGRGILVGNQRMDFSEAILFDSGSGKRMKFKAAQKPVASGDMVKNIKALAEALGMTGEEMEEVRKKDGFPIKEKDGYNVATVKAWIAANPQ